MTGFTLYQNPYKRWASTPSWNKNYYYYYHHPQRSEDTLIVNCFIFDVLVVLNFLSLGVICSTSEIVCDPAVNPTKDPIASRWIVGSIYVPKQEKWLFFYYCLFLFPFSFLDQVFFIFGLVLFESELEVILQQEILFFFCNESEFGRLRWNAKRYAYNRPPYIRTPLDRWN